MPNEVIEKTKSSEIISEFALETIIANAIKIPGVKVDREKFLSETLLEETDNIQLVIDKGPVAAGIDQHKLKKIAEKLIIDRTAKSSITSFAMGIPGGLAMSATIPADILQFYGMTLKIAQELTYLYGAKDLWENGQVNEELVRNQLILYCGVMFGVSGAAAGVRLLSSQIAKTALKKIPQKALTKTFWYPFIKQIGKAIGVKVTKKTLANGVTKVIPVIGGVISGTITFVSMKPMAERLLTQLEKSNFNYTEEDINNDIEIMEALDGNDETRLKELTEEDKNPSLFEKGKEKIGNLFKKKK